jgi:hypothetical protein
LQLKTETLGGERREARVVGRRGNDEEESSLGDCYFCNMIAINKHIIEHGRPFS